MSGVDKVFLTVLNMSITASYVALGVILIRAILRKAPKVFSYVLWAVVLFRLICPVSFPSPVSLLSILNVDVANGTRAEYVPQDIGYMPTPVVQSGVAVVDNVINRSLPQAAPAASVNPVQVWVYVLSFVWLTGFLVLLGYSVFSYIKIRARLATATLVRDNIYESDQIGTAVVCGLLKPKIYVPVGVSEKDMPYILEHERTHIRRRDYIVKPLAFVALALHWFNPLMWLSFNLMSRDMEMSCDEAVLRSMGEQVRVSYSGSLLALSMQRSGMALASPLAFSESDVKVRIKNSLNYKRPSFWLVAIIIVAVTTSAVALAANPQTKFNEQQVNQAAMLFTSTETDLVKIAEDGVYNYYRAFMGKNVPDEYRMVDYAIKSIRLIAGDEREFAVGVIADYSTTTLYFLSANGSFRPTGPNYYVCEDDYRQYRIKNLGGGKYQIVSIGTGGVDQGLIPMEQAEPQGELSGIPKLVEDNLAIIMSSPLTSSSIEDVIRRSQAYENIRKYGGEEALTYLLSQFEAGNTAGIRGQIMMHIAIDLLGKRGNVQGTGLTPDEWYKALSIRKERPLPDFDYTGDNLVEGLVYAAEVAQNSQPHRGFTVVAPRIHGQYEDGDMLKVFVTTYSATYKLYEDVLSLESAGVVPSAITYKRDRSGTYTLQEYTQARDGSEFAPSIRRFCTLNGREIPGLADRILTHYSSYSDITALQLDNLQKHLTANGINRATMTNHAGEVIFSMDRQP